MNEWWSGFLTGFIPAAAGAALGWLRWLHELRGKRTEKHGRAAAEKELHEIQRRGLGPFLRATYLSVPPFNGHSNQIVHPGKEIEPTTPLGTRITLHIANDGAPARNLDDDWSPPNGFIITPHGLPNDEHQATALSYDYDPAQKGKLMSIRLSFETLDGLKMHHVYQTRHGHAELLRKDPA